MNLASSLLQQLNDPGLSHDRRVRIRCELAREMEEAGNYEEAREALEGLWHRVGERPILDGLGRLTAAELLMRAGSLSGRIGSTRQIEGSQEIAKDLISESISIFEELGELEKTCEGRTNLAVCYWRQGAFDEARVILSDALDRLTGKGSLQEIRALLALAVVERADNRYNDALQILLKGLPLFESGSDHSLKGIFHNQLGTVLKDLGAAENRSDYVDRALVEYAAASFHFGEAGNARYRARVENNLGFLFLTGGKVREAHEHLDRARKLFHSLRDRGSMAQVDETRARAFLAEGQNAQAEMAVRSAVRTLEEGGEHALLAEALTTHGMALARLQKYEEARATLERAVEVAHTAGDSEGAGVASLTLLEEVGKLLRPEEQRELYERADGLLLKTQHPGILARLRKAARMVLSQENAVRQKDGEPRGPQSISASDEAAKLRRAERANPWEGFSLKDEVRRFEARFIERALKEAEGKVSQAARLLGFKHHESLASLLENRHRELLAARVPPKPRRRSIIRRGKIKQR